MTSVKLSFYSHTIKKCAYRILKKKLTLSSFLFLSLKLIIYIHTFSSSSTSNIYTIIISIVHGIIKNRSLISFSTKQVVICLVIVQSIYISHLEILLWRWWRFMTINLYAGDSLIVLHWFYYGAGLLFHGELFYIESSKEPIWIIYFLRSRQGHTLLKCILTHCI